MRRKVLQEFVNSFCQRILDLPEGYDLASLAHHGSGLYEVNILTGTCMLNGSLIPPLRLCDIYQKWMHKQSEKYGIEEGGILAATLQIDVEIKNVNLCSSSSHRFAHAHFFFKCQSKIITDEKTYSGQMAGDKVWAFDWFYEQLYGALPDVWPPRTK